MTTSAQTPARPLGLATPGAPAPRRPRPDLPAWFGPVTTSAYAACAALAVVLAGLALAAVLTPVPLVVIEAGVIVLGMLEAVLIVGVGAWCHTIARSRRVDPTTPQLDPTWFLVAWFVPVVHVFVPHRMFGDLWASAKWQQSDRRGRNTPLARRPTIITLWAAAWGLEFGWLLSALIRVVDATFLAVALGVSAVSLGLLGVVVHVIAKELGPVRPPTVGRGR